MKNPDDYPPAIANGALKEALFKSPRETIAAQIERRNGVTSNEIDTVLLRWDCCLAPLAVYLMTVFSHLLIVMPISITVGQ